jgi:hypothetical protein
MGCSKRNWRSGEAWLAGYWERVWGVAGVLANRGEVDFLFQNSGILACGEQENHWKNWCVGHPVGTKMGDY